MARRGSRSSTGTIASILAGRGDDAVRANFVSSSTPGNLGARGLVMRGVPRILVPMESRFPAARFTALALLCAVTGLAVPPPQSWPTDPAPFVPLTAERIAALPATERPAWEAYWAESERRAAMLPERFKADASPLQPMSGPPKGGTHSKGLQLNAPPDWYASSEARVTADRIVAGQSKIGAWPKGMDYTQPAGAPGATPRDAAPTFDNNATVSELRFLARVISQADESLPARAGWVAAFERGLRYIFAAQYPNGGFPQYYPLRGGYHDGITFNDDAMVNVLEVLRDAAAGKKTYAFLAEDVRQECRQRFAHAVECILATQLQRHDGRRTVWCQQYDPLSLRAAAARNFEPVAEASRESASITLLLMSLPKPSAEVVAAVEAAVAWFRETALADLKIRRAPDDLRGEVVPAPGAPPLWARFYQPGTTTPIFGDRDRTIHFDLSEVSAERIAGYAWYTEAPAQVLSRVDAWRRKHEASH